MTVENIRQYHCRKCNFIKILKENEEAPKECPACSHNQVYTKQRRKFALLEAKDFPKGNVKRMEE